MSYTDANRDEHEALVAWPGEHDGADPRRRTWSSGWRMTSTPASDPFRSAGTADAFLPNPIREPKITCRVCTAPVRGFDRCWRCERTRPIAGVADVVAPLMYAIAGTPSGALVGDYKNHPLRDIRQQCSEVIKQVVSLGLSRHERCIGKVAGLPVSCRLVIPSLTSRPGPHPFATLAQDMGAIDDSVALAPVPDARCDRAVGDKFVVAPATRLNGRHVLVLDDVWTTGSNAQSSALAVRRAGAAAVSVLVVGRWLNPERPMAAEFIRHRLRDAYDPGICPVTGGRCP